jgi:hypothetical protein
MSMLNRYCAACPTNIRKFIINLPGIMALAAGIVVVDGDAAWQAARAQAIAAINARVIATDIPGASAISQVGTFLNNPVPPACAHPIPTLFPTYIQPGAVLDPNRILVGSQSNFGAPLATGVGSEGSFLSIDPRGAGILSVPKHFARSGVQASTLGGAVQMFSANSPHWLNGVNNVVASTASYTGVSNPLGLSNNNAFWPPLACKRTVWRQRGRFILDPRSDRAAATGRPQPPDWRGLCGQPDKPQLRGRAAATGHPRLAECGRGGDGLPRPIAGWYLQGGIFRCHRRRRYRPGAHPERAGWYRAGGHS